MISVKDRLGLPVMCITWNSILSANAQNESKLKGRKAREPNKKKIEGNAPLKKMTKSNFQSGTTTGLSFSVHFPYWFPVLLLSLLAPGLFPLQYALLQKQSAFAWCNAVPFLWNAHIHPATHPLQRAALLRHTTRMGASDYPGVCACITYPCSNNWDPGMYGFLELARSPVTIHYLLSGSSDSLPGLLCWLTCWVRRSNRAFGARPFILSRYTKFWSCFLQVWGDLMGFGIRACADAADSVGVVQPAQVQDSLD